MKAQPTKAERSYAHYHLGEDEGDTVLHYLVLIRQGRGVGLLPPKHQKSYDIAKDWHENGPPFSKKKKRGAKHDTSNCDDCDFGRWHLVGAGTVEQ